MMLSQLREMGRAEKGLVSRKISSARLLVFPNEELFIQVRVSVDISKEQREAEVMRELHKSAGGRC